MKRLIILLLIFMAVSISAEAASVESVTATVQADTTIPPLVQKRMQQSVQVIADQLLTGKNTQTLLASQADYEQLIQEVFDKVLVGYTVKKVTIIPDTDSQVLVQLYPWSDTIKSVAVTTTVEGMPTRIDKLARQDLAGVETVFADALIGLPVAATDWTNGVLKQQLKAFLAEHLPEFRADFELETGEQATVKLVVYPRLPVVRTVDLAMRSDTVPNFALLNHRELMQDEANTLVGVPVDFVRRHREVLQTQLANKLDELSDFRAFAMKTSVSIDAAERLHIMSRSDTSRYRLRLLGWQDIGRTARHGYQTDNNLKFQLHLGTMLSKRDELFAMWELMPQPMDCGWSLGYDRLLGLTHTQLRYDWHSKQLIVGFKQPLIKRLDLRYEYRFDEAINEWGLGYKVHDFVTLEYVIDDNQNWLRVIGNF